MQNLYNIGESSNLKDCLTVIGIWKRVSINRKIRKKKSCLSEAEIEDS